VQFLIVFLILTYLRGIFEFFQEYLVSTAVWRGIMDLRCENYTHVLRAPTMFFLTRGVNDTMSRFIQDTNELARAQATLLGKTLAEPSKAAAVLVLALLLNWKLTLLALVAGPPAYFIIRKLGQKIHRASRKSLESFSSLLGVLEETLTGIRVVKAYTMEGAERKRFFQVNRRLIGQQYKMERIDAATGPLVESLGLTFGMIAAAGAAYMVFGGKLDPITFLAWMGSLFALFDPVRKLSKVSNRFQAGEAAAKRVFELTDLAPERNPPDSPTLPRHSRSIRFERVSFRYPNAAQNALTAVDLEVPAGAACAIVGPNGSGKTTLVSLLPRLLEPAGGRICIDGHDIARSSLRSLRRQIGLVTQDTVLFHASIADNIAYGLRHPRPQDVLSASRRAFVDEFVAQMPDGYDTMVGEHGTTLSGGQRQRIAIARAILRNPAILIFDEAMSQVDADSERRIQQAMAEFTRGRTTFVIAHRFATVLAANIIVVMNAGLIIDQGTHEQLLGRCELYRHLYSTQFLDTSGQHGAGASTN
jgi:ABC-type multidrug transport system fused ATPase/permease subunit